VARAHPARNTPVMAGVRGAASHQAFAVIDDLEELTKDPEACSPAGSDQLL
jgi:hypothetical protein